MDAKELRLGNYLIDKEGRLCDVVALDKNEDIDRRISASSICGAITSLPVKPIPLNEAWFKKFGFKTNGTYWDNDKISIPIMKTTSGVDIYVCPGEYTLELDYVHQLQNLYFSLIGEELEIEE